MLPTAALDPGIVFALSVFGGVCRVVAATGGAMMFTLCWSLAGDLGLTSGSVKDAAAVLVFWDLASIGMVWAQRRSINLAFALTVCLPWGVCEMAGTAFLIRQGGSPWFKRSLGLLLLGVLAVDRLGPRGHGARPAEAAPPAGAPGGALAASSAGGPPDASVVGRPATPHAAAKSEQPGPRPGRAPAAAGARYSVRGRAQLGWALFLGVAGGLLKGIFTVPMPAISAFVLFSGIEKDEWRCNGVLIAWLTTPPKAWYFFVVRAQFEASHSMGYAAAAIGAVAAIPIGTHVASFVDKDLFRDWIRVLTCTGAASLCAFATGVQLPAAFLALLLASMCALREHQRRSQDQAVRAASSACDFCT